MFAQVDIMLTHCLSFIVFMLVPLPFRAHLFPVLFLCGIIYQVKPYMLYCTYLGVIYCATL